MDGIELLKWGVGIIVSLLAAGFVIKVVVRKVSFRFISQKGNTAGGDIVAGDKITTHKK